MVSQLWVLLGLSHPVLFTYPVWASMVIAQIAHIIGEMILGGLLITKMVRKLTLYQLLPSSWWPWRSQFDTSTVSPNSQWTDPTRRFCLWWVSLNNAM